jgi:hypothetical protein
LYCSGVQGGVGISVMALSTNIPIHPNSYGLPNKNATDVHTCGLPRRVADDAPTLNL